MRKEDNIVWFPSGDMFTSHPAVMGIEFGLKDREGCWDLMSLMCFAVKHDNIIRLYPDDPTYECLRVNVLRMDSRKRRKEFPVLIDHCIRNNLISKRSDENGEYLYFNIIDYLQQKYTPKAHYKRTVKENMEELKMDSIPPLAIPLKRNYIWVCPKAQLEAWQEKYPLLDIKERLAHYSEYYLNNPERRQYASRIVASLEYYLDEDEKQAERKKFKEA